MLPIATKKLQGNLNNGLNYTHILDSDMLTCQFSKFDATKNIFTQQKILGADPPEAGSN